MGVGALGSHVAQFLRNDGDITVVDFDRVEQKNTLSQVHARNSVGKNKTVALQQVLSFLWGTKVTSVPHKLTEDNVGQILKGSGLVLDCLDNGVGRRVIQAYVRANKVPCLHGALAANGAMGQVLWDADFKIDDGAAGAPTCEDGEHLPFIGLVSCYLARAAQEYLKSGRQIGFQVFPVGASIRI